MNIFEQFMQGKQMAQQQQLGRLKLAQMQQAQELGPLQRRLQELEIERAQQLSQMGGLKLESQKAGILGRLAQSALDNFETDPELAKSIIAGGSQRYGLQINPENTTKKDLQNFVTQAQALAGPDADRFEQARGKGLEGYIFDRAQARYFIQPELKQEIEKTKQLAAKTDLSLKDISAINNNLTALTKDSRKISAAAKSLEGLEKSSSPASQLAAVFKFMKSLDPTSTVRESEQGQVYSAEGAAKGLANRINGLLGKGELSEQGFADLVNTSKNLANSQIQSARQETDSFLDAFGEKIPDKQRELFEKRVPSLFEYRETEGLEQPGQQLGTEQLQELIRRKRVAQKATGVRGSRVGIRN